MQRAERPSAPKSTKTHFHMLILATVLCGFYSLDLSYRRCAMSVSRYTGLSTGHEQSGCPKLSATSAIPTWVVEQVASGMEARL